jgi:hypothetical protein
MLVFFLSVEGICVPTTQAATRCFPPLMVEK